MPYGGTCEQRLRETVWCTELMTSCFEWLECRRPHNLLSEVGHFWESEKECKNS